MRILITGTSQGIGLACARKYASMGHEVIGFDIQDTDFKDSYYTHMIVFF